MDLIEAIRDRRSIRSYKNKEVEEEKIKKIIKCGQMAPSAGNLQARDFIVVSKSKNKKEIAEAASQDSIREASVVIVVCANKKRSASRYGERGRTLYAIQDADAATQNMLLTIHSIGLASCWIGAFDEEKVKKTLNIPNEVRPITILPIGYPDKKPTAPSRMDVDEVTHIEKW